ncbi:hypothetical protein BN2475_120169 [Paraburkholderia ribeironis]|uniref:Uncharacterized protein n=1 Tax=Paraburkholderia ribeironis TaxID=1247936 RepID=A0A1N7RRF2_9BURK|nr:hypothetical protein BN2475_120169 [Paraburkholderia ribeironis]
MRVPSGRLNKPPRQAPTRVVRAAISRSDEVGQRACGGYNSALAFISSASMDGVPGRMGALCCRASRVISA